MNYKLMLRTLGRTLQLEALCLLPPLVISQEEMDKGLAILKNTLS